MSNPNHDERGRFAVGETVGIITPGIGKLKGTKHIGLATIVHMEPGNDLVQIHRHSDNESHAILKSRLQKNPFMEGHSVKITGGINKGKLGIISERGNHGAHVVRLHTMSSTGSKEAVVGERDLAHRDMTSGEQRRRDPIKASTIEKAKTVRANLSPEQKDRLAMAKIHQKQLDREGYGETRVFRDN